jgi:hypothetical protein
VGDFTFLFVKMVEAAGVELDGFSKTGLILAIAAERESLEPPEPLKCPRAGTKQVQRNRAALPPFGLRH